MREMIESQLYKATCTTCVWAEAKASRGEARHALVEHFSNTHVDENIVPIKSLEQHPPESREAT